MLIEDDTFLIKFYKARFEQNGFDVACIEDGQAAYEKTKSEQPDLIILDIGMPHTDGFSILKELKKNPETKDIHVIILTKLAQESDRDTGKKLGASEYIVKMEVRLDKVVEQAKKYFGPNRIPSPS